MFFQGWGTHITRDMCFPGGGLYHMGYVFPRWVNTYLLGYEFSGWGNTYP